MPGTDRSQLDFHFIVHLRPSQMLNFLFAIYFCSLLYSFLVVFLPIANTDWFYSLLHKRKEDALKWSLLSDRNHVFLNQFVSADSSFSNSKCSSLSNQTKQVTCQLQHIKTTSSTQYIPSVEDGGNYNKVSQIKVDPFQLSTLSCLEKPFYFAALPSPFGQSLVSGTQKTLLKEIRYSIFAYYL